MLHDMCGTTRDGTTVRGLVEAGKKLGFNTIPCYDEYDDFVKGRVRFPLICICTNEMGMGHYVVVTGIHKGYVRILDPAVGKRKEKIDDFRKEYAGGFIQFYPDTDFAISDSANGRGVIWRFLDILKPEREHLMWIILIGFVMTILGIALSMFDRILIDRIIGNSLEDKLPLFIMSFIAINLVNIGFSLVRQHVALHLSKNLSITMTEKYYTHILGLPMRFFGTRKRGDILTRYQDANTVIGILTQIIIFPVDMIFAVVSGFFLYNLSPKLFCITVISVALTAALIYAFIPFYKRMNRESMVAESNLNSMIIESLSNMETVKANSAEDNVFGKVRDRLGESVSVMYKVGVVSNLQGTISGILSMVCGMVMMWVGVIDIFAGTMTLGILMSFNALSGFFTGPIGRFISIQTQFQEAEVAANRLSEIFDIEEESDRRTGNFVPEDLKGDIVFEGVTFRYGSGKALLKDLDLTIRQGEKVAIIGESGSGKSTLGKLITGLWMPEEGNISIGGQPIDSMDAQAIRSRIAYVQQNTELFSGKITDNLRLAREDTSFEEMVDACEKALCMGFISKLPLRFETVLEEGGANLSGGERQRLSIARALLKDSDIMILDEATSSLDMMVENRVMDSIFDCCRDKTMIVIAHRLSVANRCDRIIVMDSGRIVEDGTHESLLASDGPYAELWKSQFVRRGSDAETDLNIPEDSAGVPDDEDRPMEYRLLSSEFDRNAH